MPDILAAGVCGRPMRPINQMAQLIPRPHSGSERPVVRGQLRDALRAAPAVLDERQPGE